EVPVVLGHGARGRMTAHVGEAGVLVNRGQIGAARGTVAVEQETRANWRALVVQVNGAFEVADGVVEFILLPAMKGRIEPAGGIVRIKALGEVELLLGGRRVAQFAGGFAEIGAEEGALRLQGGGRLERGSCLGKLALPEQAETAAQPGRPQRRVQFASAVERL